MKRTFSVLLLSTLLLAIPCWSRNFEISSTPFNWQQVKDDPSFRLILDRENYSTLDRAGRMVFSVQTVKAWGKTEQLSVSWKVTQARIATAKNVKK